ncbi:MAG: hypothetical protein HY939_02550 [Gammaproteobacteria bacterium]|nr:hypothetical protein [Gammaproteobacteria bacterium]
MALPTNAAQLFEYSQEGGDSRNELQRALDVIFRFFYQFDETRSIATNTDSAYLGNRQLALCVGQRPLNREFDSFQFFPSHSQEAICFNLVLSSLLNGGMAAVDNRQGSQMPNEHYYVLNEGQINLMLQQLPALLNFVEERRSNYMAIPPRFEGYEILHPAMTVRLSVINENASLSRHQSIITGQAEQAKLQQQTLSRQTAQAQPVPSASHPFNMTLAMPQRAPSHVQPMSHPQPIQQQMPPQAMPSHVQPMMQPPPSAEQQAYFHQQAQVQTVLARVAGGLNTLLFQSQLSVADIGFSNAGENSVMLRCVNPAVAMQVMDFVGRMGIGISKHLVPNAQGGAEFYPHDQQTTCLWMRADDFLKLDQELAARFRVTPAQASVAPLQAVPQRVSPPPPPQAVAQAHYTLPPVWGTPVTGPGQPAYATSPAQLPGGHDPRLFAQPASPLRIPSHREYDLVPAADDLGRLSGGHVIKIEALSVIGKGTGVMICCSSKEEAQKVVQYIEGLRLTVKNYEPTLVLRLGNNQPAGGTPNLWMDGPSFDLLKAQMYRATGRNNVAPPPPPPGGLS